VVPFPTTHQGTIEMARVLHEEGLLGEFVPPLSLTGLPRLPRLLESRLNSNQWRYGLPAKSGAALQEVLIAATYRLMGGRDWGPRAHRLVYWRQEVLDRFVARRLSRGATGLVIQNGRSHQAARAAVKHGVPIIHFLNADPWGMYESLHAISAAAPTPAEAEDVLLELQPGVIEGGDREMRRAAVVLCESTRMANQAREHGAAEKPIVALGQGVHEQEFVPRPEKRNTPPGQLRVVQVGRVCYGKGVNITDEAVGLARSAVASAVVVGATLGYAPLLVKHTRHLKFRGGLSTAGVVDMLQQSDVFVMPTYADPMPRAVLEAMACGLPVITTPDSGYTDLIRDGENGFIVPTGDASSIARLLNRLADDAELRQRVGLAARATAEQNTWRHFAERFRSALNTAILPAIERPPV
jgi:glycosyltransferase involved in cell wall biosynthesis